MKLNIILLFVLLLCSLLFAEGSAAVFLSMPVGWRNIALGGSGVALGGDINAGWFNPAALMKVKGVSITSGYSPMALNRSLTHLAAGWNIKNDAAVSLNWVHADAGQIPGRDISGNYTHDLKYGEDAIFLTFAKSVTSDIALGTNVKYLQARLDEITAYVAGFDFGIYGEVFDDRLSLGFVYQNIGVKYQWNSGNQYGTENASAADETILSTIKFGAGYTPKNIPLVMVADIDYYKLDEVKLHAGVQWSPIDGAKVAAGIDDLLPTLGAGYEYDAKFGVFGLGYSFKFEREGLPPRHSFDITARF